MSKNEEFVSFLIHRFPKKLQKQIKVASVTTGRLMRHIVAEACTDWLKKKGK